MSLHPVGRVIYHIMAAAEWDTASRHPFYSPAAFAADGFIHCCTAEQLEYVRERHFHGKQDLVILCVDADMVTAPIKYEDLSGEGMSFPHVYGPLNTEAVRNVISFTPTGDGS